MSAALDDGSSLAGWLPLAALEVQFLCYREGPRRVWVFMVSKMKTLGIVGGVGPESTVDYYRSIIATFRERTADGSYPHLLINSIDMKQMLGLVESDQLPALAEYLADEVKKLSRAGADFALLASNTPHIVFDEVQRESPVPLLSIVECTCRAASAHGLKKLGLFGSRFTMAGSFFPKVFSREGIGLVVPSPDDQDYIHGKYMGELVKGVFLPETRAGLLAIADRLRQQEGVQGIILGGTELPLLLRNVSQPGMVFLDTTQIHVTAAVEQLLS
jgi:aspartate racemase